MRKSFTLIEVVLVLVITGLVGVTGSMALVQLIQNYTIQKKNAALEVDSAATIRQISKYLQNSIWDSIAFRKSESENGYKAVSEINYLENEQDWGRLSDDVATQELVFIEKIQEITDGRYVTNLTMSGLTTTYNSNIPYFSGFIDLDNSSGNFIVTQFPVDDLDDTLLNDIFKDDINTDGNASLYFPFTNASGNVWDKYYDTNNNGRNLTALFAISDIGTTRVSDGSASGYEDRATMTLNHTPSKIGDIATIVYSEPSTLSLENGNLTLRRNNAGEIEEVIIAQDIDSIDVWSEAASSLIRIRICYTNTTMDFMPNFCKEGVIMQ